MILTSLALIFLVGLTLGSIFKKLKLPTLIGMLLTGILLGPHVLNLLDDSILLISADFRQLALVIILTKAGLSLDLSDLKKVGRPAILLSFVPACVESIGVLILAPLFLGITLPQAALMASVLAAVSPAVVVPRMVKLMEEGYGTDKSIPQMILAGASIDDVFVIIMFTSLTTLAVGNGISIFDFLQIPISIIMGIAVGVLIGLLFSKFIKYFHIRDSVKVIILLSISFLFLALEDALIGIVSISGLLAIMTIAGMVYRFNMDVAKRLSLKFTKLWVAAEIILFVLVGATVDISYAANAGFPVVLLIIGALIFRMIGTYLSVMKTGLNKKEQLYCIIAYIPKATVQAAIGSIPLSMGLPGGQLILTVAVVSIIITAPLGAILMDNSYKKLLNYN